MRALIAARTPLRLAIAAAALLPVVLLGIAVRDGRTLPLDLRLMAIVRDAGGPPLRAPAIAVTTLGNPAVLLAVAAAAVLLLAVRRDWWQAARLALVVLGGRIAVETVKDVVARARPPLAEHLVAAEGWSFPSAHAANSAITYVAAAALLTRGRTPARSGLVTAAAALVVAIGASRTWLGVHWPVDVLAGWLLAIGWLAAVTAAVPGRR